MKKEFKLLFKIIISIIILLNQSVISKTKMDIPTMKVEEKPTSSPPLFEMIQIGQPTPKKAAAHHDGETTHLFKKNQK